MERLCDEVIQIIFYDLADPGPLTLMNKRFYQFSQDPYVRAHYFLAHYGPTEAMFHALGRGKILTEQVLNILQTSGAHLSRYLVQVAMHHYFHTASHFVKSTWVRSVPFGVFTHFLKLAEERYGDIPRAKNEDDGHVFNTFLKQSRWPSSLKSVTWEAIREMLEKYNFIPFSNRDPLMAQFPLALAIEPRLLPYAVNNGFFMDSKYRDFVFRKMFERTATNDTEEIVHNAQELCRLDHTMFISRTVAAEVCMEAKTNVAGYNALKILDKSGNLRFELTDLVTDLIKTFVKTRSISVNPTIETLRHIYADYPSSDSTARVVMLIIFFNNPEHLLSSSEAIHAKLDAFKLTPVSKKDILSVLLNPFSNYSEIVLNYATGEIGEKDDGTKGMPPLEIKGLIAELISRSLEVSCKGKLLDRLKSGWSSTTVDEALKQGIERHHITLEDLPPSDDFIACRTFRAKLSRDHTRFLLFGDHDDVVNYSDEKSDAQDRSQPDEIEGDDAGSGSGKVVDSKSLGHISQETLTSMIREDEVAPIRLRRRAYHGLLPSHPAGKLPYPSDALPVGQWIKKTFGHRHRFTAIFMTHAVINDSENILDNYLPRSESIRHTRPSERVPVTLEHFKMLAHLGTTPNHRLYRDIEENCDFYFDEEDYLKQEAEASGSKSVKAEASLEVLPPSPVKSEAASSSPPSRRRKRPRRTATTVRSYAIPDSDDDNITDDTEIVKKPRPLESNLQKWILHLGEILKDEQRKHKEQKRKHDALLEPGVKSRVYRSDFYKSLSQNLRELRKVEDAKRTALYGENNAQETYTSDDDEEYLQRTRTTKRRKTTRNS